MPRHPTRWCSQCEIDWPSLQLYNLCPKCQRCTVAETADEMPDHSAAALLRAKYAAFENYLTKDRMAPFEAAIAATPSIPDPTPDPPIAGRRYPQPQRWDADTRRWAGDDA